MAMQLLTVQAKRSAGGGLSHYPEDHGGGRADNAIMSSDGGGPSERRTRLVGADLGLVPPGELMIHMRLVCAAAALARL
jgi:hypothetical protein